VHPYHRPPKHGDSKTVSQNKPFLFISWFSQLLITVMGNWLALPAWFLTTWTHTHSHISENNFKEENTSVTVICSRQEKCGDSPIPPFSASYTIQSITQTHQHNSSPLLILPCPPILTHSVLKDVTCRGESCLFPFPSLCPPTYAP
jgi:hypothetical protein